VVDVGSADAVEVAREVPGMVDVGSADAVGVAREVSAMVGVEPAGAVGVVRGVSTMVGVESDPGTDGSVPSHATAIAAISAIRVMTK
jgi:hypothetical protein